jgi:hypothetical protein
VRKSDLQARDGSEGSQLRRSTTGACSHVLPLHEPPRVNAATLGLCHRNNNRHREDNSEVDKEEQCEEHKERVKE